MSTNFYLKRIPTEDEIKKIVDKIKSEATPDNIRYVLSDAIEEVDNTALEIHPGKR